MSKKNAADGKIYIKSTKNVKPKEMTGMVRNALNAGMLMTGRRTNV